MLDTHRGRCVTSHWCQVSAPCAALVLVHNTVRTTISLWGGCSADAVGFGVLVQREQEKGGCPGTALLGHTATVGELYPCSSSRCCWRMAGEWGRLSEHCSSTSMQSYSADIFFKVAKLLPGYHSLVTTQADTGFFLPAGKQMTLTESVSPVAPKPLSCRLGWGSMRKCIWSVQRNAGYEIWLVLTMLIQFKICLTGLKIKPQTPFDCSPVLKLFQHALPIPDLIFWFGCNMAINRTEVRGAIGELGQQLSSNVLVGQPGLDHCYQGPLSSLLGEEHIKGTHSPELLEDLQRYSPMLCYAGGDQKSAYMQRVSGELSWILLETTNALITEN